MLLLLSHDNALALWWAAQRTSDLPRDCIPAADPEQDPDGFAAALTRMPVGEFKACVYMTGVYSAIMGETEFPAAAAQRHVWRRDDGIRPGTGHDRLDPG
ncbi:hypothetical protein LP419_31135 [Massilia sp. H-1]|nr:hypothetical protein LP419_31135 [Massilia sp. H-1]